MLFRAIIICALLIYFVESYPFNDPCTIIPKGYPNVHPPNFMQVKTANVSCQTGSVYWPYPTGSVDVQFINPDGSPMAVCFKDQIGGHIFALVDVTDGSKHSMQPLPRDGESCTTQYTSDVSVVVAAPSELMYVGAVSYHILHLGS